MNLYMTEPLDIETKTRLTWSQHVAFKAACSDLGLKAADVQRALILNFRSHHGGKALQKIGIETTSLEGTD